MRLENVECQVEDCSFYVKYGFCSSPSGIVVNDRRQCISFREDFDKRKKNLTNYVNKIVCSGEQEK